MFIYCCLIILLTIRTFFMPIPIKTFAKHFKLKSSNATLISINFLEKISSRQCPLIFLHSEISRNSRLS